MGAATDRATKRDLRRAMGEGATQVVAAHEQGLMNHAEALRRHEQQLVHDRLARVKTDGKVDAFLHRGFWGRLNWLLRGR